jgi:hypothetical protein
MQQKCNNAQHNYLRIIIKGMNMHYETSIRFPIKLIE